MPRPKGYRQSSESLARQSESLRRKWAERKELAEVSTAIMNRFAAGDPDGAARIYRTHADAIQDYVDSGIPQAIVRPMFGSQAEFDEAIDAALHAVGRPVRRAFRNQFKPLEPGLTDVQIAARLSAAFRESLSDDEVAATFSRAILNQLRKDKAMKDLHPDRSAEDAQRMYDGIPTIQARAARTRQASNTLQGQRISDAASMPYVGMNNTRHPLMTGTHTHDHGAHNSTDHDDGIHQHEHTHRGDSPHDHEHRS